MDSHDREVNEMSSSLPTKTKIKKVSTRNRLVTRRTFRRLRRVNARANTRLASVIIYLQSDPDSMPDYFNFRRTAQSTRIGLRQDTKNVARDLQTAIRKFQEQSVA